MVFYVFAGLALRLGLHDVCFGLVICVGWFDLVGLFCLFSVLCGCDFVWVILYL